MQEQSPKRRSGLRKTLAGVLVIAFIPAIFGWVSIEVARPDAESIMRGSGGSHGMPGCSPPVAWALAYVHPKPLALLVLSTVSFLVGVALILSGAIASGKRSRL